MATMTPKDAPLSLLCYRGVDLVPHQKTNKRHSLEVSLYSSQWKMLYKGQ